MTMREGKGQIRLRVLRRYVAMCACICIGGLSANAWAGGDEFDGTDDASVNGPSYYGFVRDTRGVGLPRATVVLTPRVGPPVSVQTNAVGLYRSHVSKTAAPADVSVTCSFPSHVQIKIVRRQNNPGAQQVETTCILQKQQ